jgi:hypothetical protein
MLQRYRRIVFKGVYKFSNNKSEMQNWTDKRNYKIGRTPVEDHY